MNWIQPFLFLFHTKFARFYISFYTFKRFLWVVWTLHTLIKTPIKLYECKQWYNNKTVHFYCGVLTFQNEKIAFLGKQISKRLRFDPLKQICDIKTFKDISIIRLQRCGGIKSEMLDINMSKISPVVPEIWSKKRSNLGYWEVFEFCGWYWKVNI